MKKLKPVMPSLREKKRYVAFTVRSEKQVSQHAVSRAVWNSMLNLHGTLGVSEAGMVMLPDRWNPEAQRGLVRVSHRSVDRLKAALALIKTVEGQPVIASSTGASGILRKAERYLAA
ncbi:hypothetical protein HY642_06015 [Candidatus Woesearchaeota archaeon]|nr:hypothetical protein [Candidatus Woesearchaeota archaeon]